MLNRSNPLVELGHRAKRHTNLLAACLINVALIMVCTGIALLLTDRLLFAQGVMQDDPSVVGASRLILNLCLGYGLVILGLWAWLRFYESRSLSSLGLNYRANIVGKLLGGVCVGLSIVVAVFVLMWVFGSITVELRADSVVGLVTGLLPILLLAGGWTVQASTEEMLRGWLLQNGSLKYGVGAGIMVSSVIFVVLHFMGGTHTILSSVNLFLGGIFFALYALYEGSLWGVCAIHTVMNWAEQHLFGFSSTGAIPGGSILQSEAIGSDILTGGAARTGAAGSLVYTVAMLVAIGVLLWLFRKRSITATTQSS